MKNTNITLIVAIGIFLPMILSCRSTKQTSSSHTTSTTITAAFIDSAAQRLMSTHRKTTSITFLPMQTPALPIIPSPDAPAPEGPTAPDIAPSVQDLITQLIQQGGGTIIIQEDEQLQQDQSTITNHVSVQDTTTTQKKEDQQTYTQPSRASPWINKIFYIVLLLFIIILLLQCRTRQ